MTSVKDLNWELEYLCNCHLSDYSQYKDSFDLNNRSQRINELLALGIDPNIFRIETPLIATIYNANIPLLKALLSAKADPNRFHNTSPLCIASGTRPEDKSLEMVDILLKAGADANKIERCTMCKDCPSDFKCNRSPLGSACCISNYKVMSRLIKSGASIDCTWYISCGGAIRTVREAMYEYRQSKTLIPLFRDLGVHPRTEEIEKLLDLPKDICLMIFSYIPYQEDIGDALEQYDSEGFITFSNQEYLSINHICLNGKSLLENLVNSCTNNIFDIDIAKQFLRRYKGEKYTGPRIVYIRDKLSGLHDGNKYLYTYDEDDYNNEDNECIVTFKRLVQEAIDF